MWQWVRSLCLVAAFVAAPLGVAATTIAQTVVDLPDAQGPGGDLWEISFAVSGFSFAANEGFSVGFDPAEYSFLLAPGAPSADWDVLLLQPDPLLPDFGVYDALALVPGASLSGAFTLRVIFTGAGAPGALPFTVNRFDATGALLATLEQGTTTAAPEPSAAALLALCALGAGFAARRRPRVRTRAGRRFAGVAAAALVLAACVPVTHTAQVGDVKLEYRQTASVRVGRTEAEYTFTVDATNTGAAQLTGLSATVSSTNPATTIVDGTMTLGDFAPGQKRTGVDTFTIRQDRTLAFDPARLVFQVTGAQAPGVPSGLTALPGDAKVRLAWSGVANPGATYNVYRGASGGSLARIATGVAAPAFLDTTVANGTRAFYAVSSVAGGVESALSDPVLTMPPGASSSLPAPTPAQREMVGAVRRIAQLIAAGDSPAQAAAASGLRLQASGALRVTIVANVQTSSLASALSALGAQEVVTVADRADLSIPLGSLDALAALPGVEGVLPIVLPKPAQIRVPANGVSEGAAIVGAADLHKRGVRGRRGGSGQPPLRVAIIENSFHKSGAAWAKIGPHVIEEFCPVFATPCPGYGVPDAFDDPNGDHGNASAEVVLAMAPDVELVLITTAGPTGIRAAISHLLGRTDIDVVSVSLTDVMEDFYDGSSSASLGVENLTGGSVVAWAAGNAAEGQSLNDTFDPDANQFHRFDPSEFPNVQRCDQQFGNTIAQVDCLPLDTGNTDTDLWLQVDDYARAWNGLGATDLDLYVYDSTTAGLPIASTADSLGSVLEPTETLVAPGSGSSLFVAVFRETTTGANPRFRLRSMGPGIFDVPVDQARGSVGGVVTASVLSVGAVYWYGFDNIGYSGRGPTGDGRSKPDVVGPSEVSNVTFGDALGIDPATGNIQTIGAGYNGTSAATPHVAGLAALMIDDCIQWNAAGRSPTKDCSPSGIRLAMRERATDIGAFQSPIPPNSNIVLDPPNAYGDGRVNVLPPLVYQAASGGIWMRDPTHYSDFLDARMQLTATGGNPDLSPDGRTVAYECTRNGFPEICLVDVDSRVVTTLALGGAATQTAQQPAWSPDGTQIAYVERNRFLVGSTLSIAFVLKIYTVATGQVDAITTFNATNSDNPSALFPSWSPQGTFLLFTKMTPQPGFGGSRAQRWDLAEVGTNVRNVRLNDPSVFAVTDGLTDPGLGAAKGHFSPVGDGRIVYMRVTEAQNLPPLQRLANGEIRTRQGRLSLGSHRVAPGNDPRWSPGGTHLTWSRYETPGNPASAKVVVAPFVADDTAQNDVALPSLEIPVTNGQQQDQSPSW